MSSLCSDSLSIFRHYHFSVTVIIFRILYLIFRHLCIVFRHICIIFRYPFIIFRHVLHYFQTSLHYFQTCLSSLHYFQTSSFSDLIDYLVQETIMCQHKIIFWYTRSSKESSDCDSSFEHLKYKRASKQF